MDRRIVSRTSAPRIRAWGLPALALIVLTTLAARQGSPPRMAFINLPAILERTPGYAEAREIYQGELEGFGAEMQAGQNALDSMVQDYERQEVVLSPTARQEKQQQIIAEQQRLQSRQEELRVAAERRQRELLAPLESRVQSVIDGLRAERNLGVIFDIGSQFNTIVTADPQLDLSPTVIVRLSGR